MPDNAEDLPQDAADKLRKGVGFSARPGDPEELRSLAVWKAHVPRRAREGAWSLHVTRNWGLTFQVDIAEGEIYDANIEYYH